MKAKYEEILTEDQQIMERCREYFQDRKNKQGRKQQLMYLGKGMRKQGDITKYKDRGGRNSRRHKVRAEWQ